MKCPSCEIDLPDTADAFCPYCRNELSKNANGGLECSEPKALNDEDTPGIDIGKLGTIVVFLGIAVMVLGSAAGALNLKLAISQTLNTPVKLINTSLIYGLGTSVVGIIVKVIGVSIAKSNNKT
jgi:hypothetical protein